MNIVNWKDRDGNIIDSIDKMPKDIVGFTYLIWTPRGSYIGKKSVISLRKKHFGKKMLNTITDKRLKTYEIIAKESDWKKYTGSNKPLLELIKSGVEYTKTIIDYAYSKKHLTYIELAALFQYNVLQPNTGEQITNFFNDNINGTFFRKDFIFEKD